MLLNFKTDEADTIWFLWCSMIRVLPGPDDPPSLRQSPLLPMALAICQVLPVGAADCIQAVTHAAEISLGPVASAVAAMQADVADCSSGLLGYAMGMTCFVCEPKADDFLRLGASGPEGIKVAQATCDGVYAACSPVMASSRAVLGAATELVAAIFGAVSDAPLPIPKELDPSKLFDLCGGGASAFSAAECKRTVCDSVLDGFSIPLLDGLNAPALSAQMARRLQVALSEAALPGAVAPAAVAAPEAAAPLGLRERAAGHNEYVESGGFDAYAVGCEDVECPGGAWYRSPYAFGFVGAWVVLCAATVLLGRGRKARRADEALLASPEEGRDYADLSRVDR